MRIGICDDEYMAGTAKYPNLALMKVSAHMKRAGHDVRLIELPIEAVNCDLIFESKIFAWTPTALTNLGGPTRIVRGGTGYHYDAAEPFPHDIEHAFPDYELYPLCAIDARVRKNYSAFSYGYLTRGCFRQCPWCVNRTKTRVESASEPCEFIDETRKYIRLLDDNFLAFPSWDRKLAALEGYEKPFTFMQGLDCRILSNEQAMRIGRARYYKEMYFAFDRIADRDEVVRGLRRFRTYSNIPVCVYLLCGYADGGEAALNLFRRIETCLEHGARPFVMRYRDYVSSSDRLFRAVARWCNHPRWVTSMSFEEFALMERTRGGQFAKCASFEEYERFCIRFGRDGERLCKLKLARHSAREGSHEEELTHHAVRGVSQRSDSPQSALAQECGEYEERDDSRAAGQGTDSATDCE